MSPERRPGLTVVLMAWNEEDGVGETTAELLEAGDGLGLPWELVLVDDGSDDDTAERARVASRGHPAFRVVRHESNGGLGAVYRSAFREVRHELLTFFPGDGQFAGSLLPRYVEAMAGHDVVLGRMAHREAPWLSRFLSEAERRVWDFLFGSFPHFDGIVMLRSSLVDDFPLASTGRGWVVQRELLLRAHRAGRPMRHLDIEGRPRRHGASKVNTAATAWANLREALDLRALLAKEPAAGRRTEGAMAPRSIKR